MKLSKTLIVILTTLTTQLCSGQITLDSCGINSDPVLNKYEISILDSLFFTKKKSINREFDFSDKKVAFYSCQKISNTKGNGLLSKKDFFNLCRPDFRGHAGRGFIIFNEKEKTESKGFDAVILIDCPYDQIKNAELIQKLLKVQD